MWTCMCVAFCHARSEYVVGSWGMLGQHEIACWLLWAGTGA
uniref:Uncharacterized protein n=1 Tax=Globisporangium ultimum (strain ATCC 200006 / CBS 805.95 / DAOM BR144) TaxID=431595 RepID=K3WT04_GLOUD